MATFQWPTDVPFEQNADGAQIPQTYRPPTATSTEAGTQIFRRRPGPRATTVPWKSVPLTEAEAESLERFFRVTLLEATLPFMMPVYRVNQGYVMRRCQLQNGEFSIDASGYPTIYAMFNVTIFNL